MKLEIFFFFLYYEGMSCDHPLTAVYLGVDSETGKKRIKIKRLHIGESLEDFRQRFGRDRVVFLPCGHCPSCLLAKRREWMIRCACEAKYHDYNCFLTLTYDNFHYDGELHKEHFQEFILNIRNAGFKVRYFACGEFGSRSGRAHMHAILFGFLPDDLKYSHDSDSGEKIFTSEFISKCWPYGLAVVQYFTPKAAGYVAGYTNKKFLDERGFLMTSRRPGLGYQYFQDHKAEIYKYDKIQDDFSESIKSCNPSRYYDKLMEESDPFYLDLVKDERVKKSEIVRAMEYFIHGFLRDEDILNSKREFSFKKLTMLKRGF